MDLLLKFADLFSILSILRPALHSQLGAAKGKTEAVLSSLL